MASRVPNGEIGRIAQRYGTYALLDDGRVLNDAIAGQTHVVTDGRGRNVTPPPPTAWHAVSTLRRQTSRQASKQILLRTAISPDVRLAFFVPFRVRLTATSGSLRVAASLGSYENFACQIGENFSNATRISLHHLYNPSPYYDEPAYGQWHERSDILMTQLPDLRYFYIVDGGYRESLFRDRTEDLMFAQTFIATAPSGILCDQTPFASRVNIPPNLTCGSLEYFGVTYRYLHPSVGEVGRGAAWNHDYSPYTLYNTSGAWSYARALGYACILQPGARLENSTQTTTTLRLREVVESPANIASIAAQFPIMTRMTWDFTVVYADATHAGQIEVTIFTRNPIQPQDMGAFATNRFRWYAGYVSYDGFRDYYGWHDIPMTVFPYWPMYSLLDTPDGTEYILQETPYTVECATLNNMHNPYALTIGGCFPIY